MLSALPGELHGADVPVTGITSGTSFVHPGDLFAGLPGSKAHGARFADDAIAAGAVAVLTDAAGRDLVRAGVPLLVVDDVRGRLGDIASLVYGNPSAKLDVLGVTGTSGKTTTTFLMEAGLRAAGRVSGLIGTVGIHIGDKELKTAFTTPEAPELQALFAVMVEAGVTDVAMEVSSHALSLGRVGGTRFKAAGFTNLSEDHLDFHPTMEDYFLAKASLFEVPPERSVVVIDDDWGKRLAAQFPASRTVSTKGDAAAWWAEEITELPDGPSRFQVMPSGVRMGCAIPGRYNVANAVLAIAMLAEAGLAPESVAGAISAATVPGRMEPVSQGQHFLALVDYSHKPAAVEGALAALRPLTSGRLIIVLGCGGDRDRGKRPHMGEIAARNADVLIVTDDNPRSENPADIRRAMLEGALAVPAGERGDVREIGDRRAAIRAAVDEAESGDTVLIAGKGHELGQEIAGVIHPFDDRDELRLALGNSR